MTITTYVTPRLGVMVPLTYPAFLTFPFLFVLTLFRFIHPTKVNRPREGPNT